MKSYLAAVIAVLFVFPLAARVGSASSHGVWMNTDRPNCAAWAGAAHPGEEVLWSGDCLRGKAHGEGKLIWRHPVTSADPGDAIFIGQLKAGIMHGEGTYAYRSGNRYQGKWRDGKMHGYGVLTWKSGYRYEGEWRESKRHGFGTLTWPGGSRYEGNWLNSRPHGFGTYVKSSGETFSGDWKNGCFSHDGQKAWIYTPRTECESD